MVTDFGANWRKLAETPSFCVLAFDNKWEDRNLNVHVNTAGDYSTSDKNLVKFGPVTPEFCWSLQF